MLHAEDDGFFISTGYQIGEALQKVKNTGEIQKLSDKYENLSNFFNFAANNTNALASNFAANNTLTTESINTAVSNLNKSAKDLATSTSSPAYQAVALALSSAVGLWQTIGYSIPCGPGNNGSDQTFDNTPTPNKNTTTCNQTAPTGSSGSTGNPLSSAEYAKINEAYQIIQAAFKAGIPALDSKGTTIEVTITGDTTTGGTTTPTKTTLTATNDAQSLLTQASTIINTLTTQCPKENLGNGDTWGVDKSGNVCQIFSNSFSAITNMINTAQQIVTQTQQLNTNQQTLDNFNPNASSNFTFAHNMLKDIQSQEAVIKLVNEVMSDFKTINPTMQGDLQGCNSPNGVINSNTWGSGCANFQGTLSSLETYNASYSNQINQAQAVANSLFNNSFNSKNPNVINWAINNLDGSANNLIGDTKTSPAYQAVLLAINAAVGFWNVVGYVTQCGGNGDQKSTSSTTIFNNEPGYRSTSITCGYNNLEIGYFGVMSIDNMKKLNQAYQILQAALKKGLGALNQNNGTLNVSYSYECSGQGNTNCTIKLADGKDLTQGGSETTTQTIDGQKVSTTISSKVVPYSNDSNYSYTEITNALNGVPDNAQALLAQASTLINTINTACPHYSVTNKAGGPQMEPATGELCGFTDEISAIQKMITDAQELVAQSKTIADTPLKEVAPNDFNPYSSTNTQLAQNMLANASAQAKMLDLANQVGQTINPDNLSGTFKNFVTGFLATCNNKYGNNGTQGSPPGTVTTQTFASGCAYVEETLTNLNNSIAHFGTQAQQIQQAENIADTLVHFKSRYNELGSTYNSITTALSKVPNAQSLQNVVSKKNNPYSPQGIETNYYLNQNSYNQVQTINQELGRNPFRKVGILSSQTNNGAMNGIGIQVGYKQFFGQKRKWGARYYGFFDYNHAFIKSSFFNSASDVWTYGFGADALYNFINDKATNFLGKNNKLSVGLFGGIALAGTSWLNSEYVNLATVNNVYNAKMNVANFQFLFNMGVRMNLARAKKKGSDHAAQHGIELGLKIPTINTNYYSFMGAELKYRRLYSVYLNYVFAY
ncbi:SabA family sialic acid-binding adhesin [Helicobacter pylori]